MVNTTIVRQCNARFASEHHSGLVCVFAGATSGIGAGTLERMALMLHEPTFYVIGRSAARFTSQRSKLQSLNASCKIIFLEAEVSLLSDVDRVCKQITDSEKKVDCLYMSPGMMPLNNPECAYLHVLYSRADRSRRHEGGPRDVLCDFILLQDAAHVESPPASSSVATTSSSVRPRRWQGESNA